MALDRYVAIEDLVIDRIRHRAYRPFFGAHLGEALAQKSADTFNELPLTSPTIAQWHSIPDRFAFLLDCLEAADA